MGDDKEHFRSRPFLIPLLIVLTGCSSTGTVSNQTSLEQINRQQSATIQSLNREIQRLNAELKGAAASVPAPILNEGDLSQTKSDLESSLSQQVESGDLSVSMQDRGVVVTVLDRVLFSPGSAALKPGSLEALDKVAEVLQGEARDHMIYIEGHTDNVPIHSSGWKSNWELSTGRATEVIHYFMEQKGIDPARLAATGYGEFQPVVSNDTPEGRMKNRRVEIVISPKKIGV
jgi:chemotaxis protein MotB